MLDVSLIDDEHDRLMDTLVEAGIPAGDLSNASTGTPRAVVVDFVTVQRAVGEAGGVQSMLGFRVQLVVARRTRIGHLFLRALNILLDADYTIVGPLQRAVGEAPLDSDLPADFVSMVVVTKTPMDVY